jgi:lycopene cyclase domain-containing protein
MSSYFLVLFFAVVFPFLLSFDRKVAFYRLWKYVFPAILITALLFILWDILYTYLGVWSFNQKHLSGIYFFNLPVEEVLFFIAIPYAALFTYEVLLVYFPRDYLGKYARFISLFLVIVLIPTGLIFYGRLYTSANLILGGLLILFFQFVLKVSWMGRFYLAFGVILIPFILVNGILTGSWIDGEIVSYNDAENLGLRILTIPAEDIFYGMSLILLNTGLFEYFRTRKDHLFKKGASLANRAS